MLIREKKSPKPGKFGLKVPIYSYLYTVIATLGYNSAYTEERDQYPSSEPVTIPVWPRTNETTYSSHMRRNSSHLDRLRKYVNGNRSNCRHLCKDQYPKGDK